ncbi:response regulator [Mastigocoleus testarum]|uniref:Response regulatory domain-containing protein n=1 Tax=Mastigocoleus testarum BC008 TaxID=371196 RepID=A0A0V7ZHA8_9CYAN|nr:response regulator transcription factor [Mastigocoleus testarum]KST63842.1 hypothetical protein BC008_15415 [Mastigocoleus testarum BC008]
MIHNLQGQAQEQALLTFLVVDDHNLILGGTLEVLKKQYPEARLLTTKTAQDTLSQVQKCQPDLVVLDLSIPEENGKISQIETGIKLLQQLMKEYPDLNLMVQSSYIKALVRIKHDIDAHHGGFTVADKGLLEADMLTRVDLSLKGVTHTKDLKTKLEVKPEWLEVLRLAFEEGLQDKAIAQKMFKSERMVRHYWTKIQDVLGIYPEYSKKEGKNIRIETEIRARKEGLID